MDKKGYISPVNYEEYRNLISRFPNRSTNIGPVAQKILRLFLKKAYMSTYQIHSFLKEHEYSMAYKNVHKRIQKLYSLNLIEKVKQQEIRTERESIHAAVFYRLTTGGIFHLLYKDNADMATTTKGIIFKYYGNDIIFKTFLYPYVEKETILQFKTFILFTEIFRYLFKCCEITEYIERVLDKEGISTPLTMPLFNWDEVPEKYDHGTLMMLANHFKLDLQEPKIEKIDNDKTIKISSKKNSLIIRLDNKKDKATLTTDDGKIYELYIERSKSGQIIINLGIGTYVESALEKLAYQTEYNVLNFAFSIIMGITEREPTLPLDLDSYDFKYLSCDTKFTHLLGQSEKVFRERYHAFIKLNKNTSNK